MANGMTIGMTGGVMPKSPDDIQILSDNIENYSTILVTESTPNLSDILLYQVYGSEYGFTFYVDPKLPVVYIVSDNLKSKSTILMDSIGKDVDYLSKLIQRGGYFDSDGINVISIDDRSNITEIPLTETVDANIISQGVVTKSRFSYPTTISRSRDTTNNRITILPTMINRYSYPSVR